MTPPYKHKIYDIHVNMTESSRFTRVYAFGIIREGYQPPRVVRSKENIECVVGWVLSHKLLNKTEPHIPSPTNAGFARTSAVMPVVYIDLL